MESWGHEKEGRKREEKMEGEGKEEEERKGKGWELAAIGELACAFIPGPLVC